MRCKEAKKNLLYIGNQEDLSSETIEHIEGCEECREYLKQIKEMRKILGEKEEYDNKQIYLSLDNLKESNNLKGEDIKCKLWFYNRKKVITGALSIMLLALLFVPINKTCIAMEIFNLWGNNININNNGEEISLDVGDYEVNIKSDYPEIYKLTLERDKIINEILSKKDEKEAYNEIDKIIEQYNEKFEEESYKELNPKPTVYKHFKDMNDFKKEVALAKEINPSVATMFELNKITYSEYGVNYKRVDLQYYDSNNEDRINHEKRRLGITYIFQKQTRDSESCNFPKGSKLKKISIGKYNGYVLNQDSDKYSHFSVGILMDDCKVTVYSKSKLEDSNKNESMLMDIAKSITNQ